MNATEINEVELTENLYERSALRDLNTARAENEELLSNKQLNAILPQMFMRDGRIRKAPFVSMPRGVQAIAQKLRIAEMNRREVVEEKKDLVLYMDAGTLVLSGELRDIIVAADLFGEIILKGWILSTRKF